VDLSVAVVTTCSMVFNIRVVHVQMSVLTGTGFETKKTWLRMIDVGGADLLNHVILRHIIHFIMHITDTTSPASFTCPRCKPT